MPGGSRRTPSLAWQVEITRDDAPGVPVLAVKGRLGNQAAPALAEALEGALPAAARGLVLDLGGVDYISSPALRSLRAAAERLRDTGRRLVLCHVEEPVGIGLDLAGVSELVDLAASREQAITAAARAGQQHAPRS